MSKYLFKNSGKSIKSINKKNIRQEVLDNENILPIGIVLPLRPGSKQNENLFSMTYDENEQIKINLKNLILIKKGEVLGNPDLGTNLINLYNSTNLENIDEIAMEEVKLTVNKYMPFVSLMNYTSSYISATEESSPYYEINILYNYNDIQNELFLKIQTSR
tara:strand:+ start:941 stop:1423 length:483 start_codon:yes stop_codon:yes gene_type:complete